MTEPVRIDKATAQKLILACQGLFPPRSLSGKKGALSYLKGVRSIQFDPINIVGRNPDLVFQSRVSDYRPEMLDEMLYQDRDLVDNWDKMASLSLAEDWPYFSRHRSRMEDIFGIPTDVVMSLAPEVIDQIKMNGPQCSLDFKSERKTDWAWGPTRVYRAALEGLFKMGKLGVHHRVNNRRYFDLIENLLLPDLLAAPDPNSSLEDYQRWHLLRRVSAMGLAHTNAGEQWSGIIGIKTPQRRKILKELAGEGIVVEIEIEEIPGEIFYLNKQDLHLLESIQHTARDHQAAFIAPLDNLLWDRKNLIRLFDFQYMWEVYKPRKDRLFGYYVLPILYGHKFIGRFDPAFHKETRILSVQDWWWEEDFQPDTRVEEALVRSMRSFLSYLDAAGMDFPKHLLNKDGLGWLGEFK